MSLINTIDEIQGQYGTPGRRNQANTEEIEAAVKPFAEGNAEVLVDSQGKIISSESEEIKHLKQMDPKVLEKLVAICKMQRSF